MLAAAAVLVAVATTPPVWSDYAEILMDLEVLLILSCAGLSILMILMNFVRKPNMGKERKMSSKAQIRMLAGIIAAVVMAHIWRSESFSTTSKAISPIVVLFVGLLIIWLRRRTRIC